MDLPTVSLRGSKDGAAQSGGQGREGVQREIQEFSNQFASEEEDNGVMLKPEKCALLFF